MVELEGKELQVGITQSKLSKSEENSISGTFGRDGDVGRHTVPPCTTKKDNNKFKNKINQNRQKIKLYGNPTTKELKKKHSSR